MAQLWQSESFTRHRVLHTVNFTRQTVQQTIATVDSTSCSIFRHLIPYTTMVIKMKYSALQNDPLLLRELDFHFFQAVQIARAWSQQQAPRPFHYFRLLSRPQKPKDRTPSSNCSHSHNYLPCRLCLLQPRSQGLSSLPPLVVGTETLLAAGHVTIYPKLQGGWLLKYIWSRGKPS